jgi:hypothetical protein
LRGGLHRPMTGRVQTKCKHRGSAYGFALVAGSKRSCAKANCDPRWPCDDRSWLERHPPKRPAQLSDAQLDARRGLRAAGKRLAPPG